MNLPLSSLCREAILENATIVATSLVGGHGVADSVKFTSDYTRELSQLIQLHEGQVFLEFGLEGCTRPPPSSRVAKWGDRSRPRVGHLDIFARFLDGSSLAVEIDRSNKVWSLEKLAFARNVLRSDCVWIRWRGRAVTFAQSEIAIVDISKACECRVAQ